MDDPQLHLSLSRIAIEQVRKTKLLGVMLDEQLSWSDHIDGIVAKMGRGIAMIRKCSTYLTSSVISQVIQSLVFCHLQYCPVIWSAASKKDINKLQLVQNRAARLALQCSRRTNIAYMHTRLSWFSVEVKLHYSLITFFRNIIFNQTPEYFFNQMQSTTNRHNHYTRSASSGHLIPPTPRTNILKHTVIYRSVMSWNSLPSHISSTQNKLSFTKFLKKHLLPPTIY